METYSDNNLLSNFQFCSLYLVWIFKEKCKKIKQNFLIKIGNLKMGKNISFRAMKDL